MSRSISFSIRSRYLLRIERYADADRAISLHVARRSGRARSAMSPPLEPVCRIDGIPLNNVTAIHAPKTTGDRWMRPHVAKPFMRSGYTISELASEHAADLRCRP